MHKKHRSLVHEDWELWDVSDLAPYHDKRWPDEKYGHSAREHGRLSLDLVHEVLFGSLPKYCKVCIKKEEDELAEYIVSPTEMRQLHNVSPTFSGDDEIPIF